MQIMQRVPRLFIFSTKAAVFIRYITFFFVIVPKIASNIIGHILITSKYLVVTLNSHVIAVWALNGLINNLWTSILGGP